MNPVYDNSVPFYPTIPNQNPINTFFPNQLQHNGQYSRDTYAPHFHNPGYPNPPPLNVPYPPTFGYNPHRFFPPPNPRSVYPNLGPNPNVPSMYSHHNEVNPGYYPNTNSGMTCDCANPVNSNHGPPYPRLVQIGNYMYPLPHSTEFNPPNHWPGNQNNTSYPPANNVAGNSTYANWPYHPNFNQTASSYTQPAHNCQAGHHAGNSINRPWVPYSNRNTFQPIPDQNNDDLIDFSFDAFSSPSELNLFISTPDLCNHNITLPNTAHVISVNSSQSTLEARGNHTDINQNSENVISTQATEANVSSLDHRICSCVQEEPIPSLANPNSANEVPVKCSNSDPVQSDSATTAGQSANTGTPVSTLNTSVVKNGTETVAESNDTGLNQVINSRVDFQNIEAKERDQTLEDCKTQAEKISTNAIEPESIDVSALKTTVSSTNLEVDNITTVNPQSPELFPINMSPKPEETAVNLDHTYHNVNDFPMNSEENQSLNNNTEEPNNNSQLKPQTAEPNVEKLSPKCATADEVNLPTQIMTNFRRLLTRCLNRLDNVNTASDSPSDSLNIDDDLINSFVAILNSENRRLLQDPNNIGTPLGSSPKVTENVGNEHQENVNNIEKKAVEQNGDTEIDLKKNQETVRNIEKKEAKHNGELDLKENQENASNTDKKEAKHNGDKEPEVEQCNVLLESCVGREEDSTESQQHEYQSPDDLDVVNMDLDTIEVTIGDMFNSSMEEEFFEDVPLDLAKEKEKTSEPEADAKSRYFEVSQFLPEDNMYWHNLDALEDNKYASYANATAAHSVDVLVELPLNLTCKNRSNSVESQTEDIASNHPSVLIKEESSEICESNATNRDAMKEKVSDDLMKKMLFAKIITKHSGSEPPMKKMCFNPGESIILVKTEEPEM